MFAGHEKCKQTIGAARKECQGARRGRCNLFRPTAQKHGKFAEQTESRYSNFYRFSEIADRFDVELSLDYQRTRNSFKVLYMCSNELAQKSTG